MLRATSVIGFALIALLVACARPTVSPALTQGQALTWLDSKSGSPEMDVSGAWESTSPFMAGGWGNASLVQMGSKVSGTLGLYTVEGRVAGKQIFLMILSNGQVYYTAILEPTKDGGIAGMAVSKILADDPEAKLAERAPISLVRIPSK